MKIQSILPLLVISIHWMCLSHNNYMVSGLCLEDQKSLMLQLKNNLTFKPENSIKLKTWNRSIDCCQWGGVTCDAEGHITGLDLSGELICGGFDDSSSLFNLQHLQFLNLADNDFNSTIPSKINKLENLAYLNLSNAGFVGQIPKEISHLTGLVTLDLSCVDSYGLPKEQQRLKLENPNISKLVQNLTSLRKLYLDGVLISTQVREWSNSLLSLPGLQELSMPWCDLLGPLVSSLARLENLSVLILDFNDLSSPVPNTYADFKELTTLSLSYCGLIGTFPQKIFQVQALSVIDVSGNNNLHGSFPEFSPNGSLHTIEVRDTSFSGALPPSIGNMMQLSTVDLSRCQFNGTLPNSLSKLPELRHLYLSSNKFIITNSSFKGLQNLISIDLSNNSIGGSIPSYLFTLPSLQEIRFTNNHFSQLEEFTNVSSSVLRLLDLSYNSIKGSIPSSLFTLPSLEEIQLSNNQFNQLDEFTNVSSSVLRFLDLSYNSMNGRIPLSLFTLASLEEISLSNNHFSQLGEFTNVSSSVLKLLDLSLNSMNGSIHSSLFTLPSLEEIHLSNNQFNQLDEFTNVSSSVLRLLDLSSNDLSGPIPASIFQLGRLDHLELSSNKLNGTIHLNQFLTIRNLTSLDFSNNNLSFNENVTDADIASFPILDYLSMASCNLKTFPAFLRYQFSLFFLELSDNQIQGTVPNWIWKLGELQVLNLSYNFLTDLEGPFPIITPSFLEVLALHHNRLQGPIPFFPKDASYVVHSSDKFSSDIPIDSGSYMNMTNYLSLANNNFSGSIPESICTASNLLVLDLSHNNFSGVLPSCLMTRSKTLGVLKLGSNNLIGPIPNTFPVSCALHTIDLSRNRLDGSLPKSLANCTELEVLDIGRNLIVDGFPCFLNNISTLRVLVMQNNKFHGPIGCPTDNGDWPMLQIVDLAFNQFSGKLLGKWFKSWKAMMSNEDETESQVKHIEFAGSSAYQRTYRPSYQDSVTIMSKGLEMELVRILTVFTSIDFSYNEFEGPIPKELMDFKALYVLNLSNNALSGHVPSSIGNLKDLESLDLSNNSLEGEIPIELASLNFLSVLNLSFNHLTGKIPTSTQLQSFQPSSFEGNDGLYGPPLTQIPNYGKQGPSPPASLRPGAIDWNFLSAELGLVFGLGIVIGPLLFWKRWRLWYWELSDRVLCRIFPQLSLEYETRKGKRYKVLIWRH